MFQRWSHIFQTWRPPRAITLCKYAKQVNKCKNVWASALLVCQFCQFFEADAIMLIKYLRRHEDVIPCCRFGIEGNREEVH